MATINVNYSNIPQGKRVFIPGLGAFANGQKHEVSDTAYELYQKKHPGWDGTFSGSDDDSTQPTEGVSGPGEPVQTNALEDMTHDELYERATELNISGRSNMTKSELIQAINEEEGQ